MAHHRRQVWNLPIKLELAPGVEPDDRIGVPEKHAVKAAELAFGPAQKRFYRVHAAPVVIECFVPERSHPIAKIAAGLCS